MYSDELEVRAANAGLLAPTAGDLAIAVENGETEEEVTALVRQLGQRDYIAVLQAIRTVEKNLVDYARSWREICYSGEGVNFPGAEASTAAQPAAALEVELVKLVVAQDDESLKQADTLIFGLNAAGQRQVRRIIDYIKRKLDEAAAEWEDITNYPQNESLKASA